MKEHTDPKDCPTWSDYYYAGFLGCNCQWLEAELKKLEK